MRHEKLLTTTAALLLLPLLLAMRGQDREADQAMAAVPACTCQGPFKNFIFDNNCSATGQNCAQDNVISDTLACNTVALPGPCPISGSVTITLDQCATVVCVWESHTGCTGTSCPGTTPYTTLTTQGTHNVSPTQSICCQGGTGCTYTFSVAFYTQGTTCPGMPTNARCQWDYQERCY